MGAETSYGYQKVWNYGTSFDGMFKKTSLLFDQPVNCTGVSIYRVSETNGIGTGSVSYIYGGFDDWYIFWRAPDDDLGSGTALESPSGTIDVRIYSNDVTKWADITVVASELTAETKGDSITITGGKAKFSPENDFLFPDNSNASASLYCSASASSDSAIAFTGKTRVIAESSTSATLQIGGATNPQGRQKFWHNGLTFFGVREYPANSTKFATNKLGTEILWLIGEPAGDVFPYLADPPVPLSPTPFYFSKSISPSWMRKRSSIGYPTKIKIISSHCQSIRGVNYVPILSWTQPINITGVVIKSLSDMTNVGNATLDHVYSEEIHSLGWKDPESEAMTLYQIPINGIYRLFSFPVLISSRWADVQVVLGDLPTSEKTDIITVSN